MSRSSYWNPAEKVEVKPVVGVGVDPVGAPIDEAAGRVTLNRRARQPVVGLVLELRRAEDGVLLGEEVHAGVRHETERVPTRHEGVPRQVGRAYETVHVLVVDDVGRGLEDVAVGEGVAGPGAVVALAQVDEGRGRRERHPVADAAVVVVGEAASGLGVERRRADAEEDRGSDALVHVQLEGLLVVARAGDDPAVVLDQPRDVVAGGLVPPIHAQRALEGEGGVPGQEFLVVVERVGRVEVGRVGAEGVHRVVHRVELAQSEVVGLLEEAQTLREVEAWRAHQAALGGDQDHAVGGLRAVDRRRRRALEDLDALDVVGVEVGDPVRRVVLLAPADRVARRHRHHVHVRRDLVVADDHAVDDVERPVVPDDRRSAAQLHLDAAPGRAVVGLHVGPGDTALQGLLEAGDGSACKVLRAHRGNRVGKVLAAYSGRLPGHDDLVEVEHVPLELDGNVGLPGGNGDLDAAVADDPHGKSLLAGRQLEGEVALVVGVGVDGGAFHIDQRGCNRDFAARFGDLAGHGAGLGGEGGCPEEHAEDEEED